ncbi:fumarylacetoacetate hydrolase family protein [Aquabacterium sp.]|uniref:fumarylacetoacetate hydrolase family protein n=1 Tax=Aquabacterium sp. TaxID=1872578 RepID=UPI003784DC57
MRIATVLHQGRRRVGRLSADGAAIELFDVEGDAGALAVIARPALPDVTHAVPLAEVQLLAPIPRPRRNIFCVGRNYHAHARELKDSVFRDHKAEGWPIVFTKVPETVIATGEAVQLPGAAISSQIDYEAELTIVIGRGGRNIPRSAAMDHVWGYTIVNDVTARDVQMRHSQWDLGKSFDTFCPMGPWIVTADELDGRDTRVRCWVMPAGGAPELRQDARTRDLIFDIPTLIETCSRGITLLPGDLIATGSPAGVGMGMNPPRWLGHGDAVRIEIDGLGVLENRFVDPSRTAAGAAA